MIIAVDGHAASGKGTIAKRVAAHYNLAHLDTGSLYRSVGMGMVKRGEDIRDVALATAAALNLQAEALSEDEIRSEAAGTAASVVAAYEDVRAALKRFQRAFAENPPGGKTGAVIDGRDIGTVIWPNAEAKLFVTASLDVRTDRRVLELQQRGAILNWAEIRADLADRDERDENRPVSPLLQAEDAYLLDTTKLDIEAAVAAAIAVINARLGQP
ncbi:MAG: (d)CMP kinase [Alphaproteobacteria bacterium]|nr:MAG: (d)CMP kinase [Alphaproteobacteria bacterium]